MGATGDAVNRGMERYYTGMLWAGTIASVGFVIWGMTVGDRRVAEVMWPFALGGVVGIVFFRWLDARKKR